jgi:hypothetical protein
VLAPLLRRSSHTQMLSFSVCKPRCARNRRRPTATFRNFHAGSLLLLIHLHIVVVLVFVVFVFVVVGQIVGLDHIVQMCYLWLQLACALRLILFTAWRSMINLTLPKNSKEPGHCHPFPAQCKPEACSKMVGQHLFPTRKATLPFRAYFVCCKIWFGTDKEPVFRRKFHRSPVCGKKGLLTKGTRQPTSSAMRSTPCGPRTSRSSSFLDKVKLRRRSSSISLWSPS